MHIAMHIHRCTCRGLILAHVCMYAYVAICWSVKISFGACVVSEGRGGQHWLLAAMASQEVSSSSTGAAGSAPQPPSATELCILAKRGPKVKKSGDPEQEQVLEDQRTALVGVIQHLKEHPEKNLACWMALTSGKIVVTEADDLLWPRSYTCIAKLPKYFKCQLMHKVEPARTKKIWNAVDLKDAEAVNDLFQAATQISQHMHLPVFMRNKMMCATVLLLRLTECGSRPVKWQQRKAILEDGSIKLRQTSAYQVKYDHDIATEVSFNDAAVAIVDKDNTWSNTHEMMDPLTDMLCCFKKGAGSVSMEQLFSPGEGPHKTHVVSQPKKQDQNVFHQLEANMKGLPSHNCPGLTRLTPTFGRL